MLSCEGVNCNQLIIFGPQFVNIYAESVDGTNRKLLRIKFNQKCTGSWPRKLLALAALNYKKERQAYILGLGVVMTLSGQSAAATTESLSPSCNSTRHVHVTSLGFVPSALNSRIVHLSVYNKNILKFNLFVICQIKNRYILNLILMILICFLNCKIYIFGQDTFA